MKEINSESDYLLALRRLEEIFDSQPNTVEGDEAYLLCVMIDEWEKRNFPLDQDNI